MSWKYVTPSSNYASASGLARESIAEARRETAWWFINVVIGNQPLREAMHGNEVTPDLSEELLGKIRALREQLHPSAAASAPKTEPAT